MKLTLDPKTVALLSCFKKMLIFSSFCKPSFFKQGKQAHLTLPSLKMQS